MSEHAAPVRVAAPTPAPVPAPAPALAQRNALAPLAVQVGLATPARPLDAASRAFFEPRVGRDLTRVPARGRVTIGPEDDEYEREADRHALRMFRRGAQPPRHPRADLSDVRLHIGSVAAASAQAIGASAFTLGHDIVLGVEPTPALLAHELTHVLQQDGEPARVQRSPGGFLANIFRFWDYSESDLQAYLRLLDTRNAIEDDWDSDDKARQIVRDWSNGDGRYVLTPRRKALLIREMLSVWASPSDQMRILQLLQTATAPELDYIFGPGLVSHTNVLDSFGWHSRELNQFYMRRYPSAYPNRDEVNELLASSEPEVRPPDRALLRNARATNSGEQIGSPLANSAVGLRNPMQRSSRRKTPLTLADAQAWVAEVYGTLIPRERSESARRTRVFPEREDRPDTTWASFLGYCYAFARDMSEPARTRFRNQCDAEERDVQGFYDREDNSIHIRSDRESPTTMLHEVVHSYAHPRTEELARYAKEGLTEYITRRVVERHRLAPGEARLAIGESYGGPYAVMQELSLVVGEDLVARVHFAGAIPQLCAALGADRYTRWNTAMEDKDAWERAIAILRGPNTPGGTCPT